MDEKSFNEPFAYTNELKVIDQNLTELKNEVNMHLENYFLKDDELMYKEITYKKK